MYATNLKLKKWERNHFLTTMSLYNLLERIKEYKKSTKIVYRLDEIDSSTLNALTLCVKKRNSGSDSLVVELLGLNMVLCSLQH